LEARSSRASKGMSTDATILPLRDSPVGDVEPVGRRSRIDADGEHAALVPRSRVGAAIGALALALIVALTALIVLAAADRPSFLAALSHYGYFPHWLAGPLGGVWTGLTRNTGKLKSLFSLAIAGMYVAYLVGLKYVPQLRARWAIAAVVAVQAILFLSPPLELTDVFNYINYGRMEMVHHLNPYTTIPALEPHGDPSYDLSNWHNLLSPYGPIFTLITFAVVPLGIAGALWAFKGLLMVASLATILLVWKCARLLGRDPVQAIVLVGLNPIVLVWGLGGDHNDFLTVFCIVLGIYLLLRAPAANGALGASGGGRWARVRAWLVPLAPLELGAGAAFVAASTMKASAGILIPVVLASQLRAPRRLVQVALGMVLAGLVLGACSVAAFGPHLPDLGAQARLVIGLSLPNLLGLGLGLGGETETLRTAMNGVLVLSVLACGVVAWRRRDVVTTAGWATVALLVTLSWVLPWYVLWVLPMAALSRSRTLRVVALAMGAYLILIWTPMSTSIDKSIGLRPNKTTLGQLDQRYVRGLLN
jgi:hypothetical protein